MTTGEIGLEDHCALDLASWLQNEEVGAFQKNMEEKIMRFVFSHNPEEAQFFQAIQMLAWIGCRSMDRAFLQREILALGRSEAYEVIPCGILHSIKKTSCKVGHFIVNHKTEILVGAVLLASGIGLAVATGYTCSVVVGGVVVAGAGSIFTNEEEPKRSSPNIPPPSSKEEIALAGQSIFPPLPRLELPSAETEFLVTADGIWANGQFFSGKDLIQQSLFAEELSKLASFEKPSNHSTSSLEVEANHIPASNGNLDIQAAPQVYSDAPRMHEPQPRRSKPFAIEGKSHSHCYIGWINGINNSFQESHESASYIQTLAGGYTISGIYNCTHGPIVDVLEAAFLNHQGYSPNTARLLQNEWEKYHEENRDRPHAKLLQVCHSQGAIDVKNALINSSPEIQNRVIVVAIAPAAVVPTRLCFKSYNYASQNDFVYKLEPPPPQPVIALTIDDVVVPTFGEAIDDRGELIILKSHPEAEGIDHAFQSPTYQSVLERIIARYYQHKGEYLPEEKERLE